MEPSRVLELRLDSLGGSLTLDCGARANLLLEEGDDEDDEEEA